MTRHAVKEFRLYI